jgi:pyrroline-5-carboxylate reductase
MPTPVTIGILGLGHLGAAIADGLRQSTFKNQLLLFDHHETKRKKYPPNLIASSATNLAKEATVLILAIRPQQALETIETMHQLLNQTLVCSPVAGLTCAQLTSALPNSLIVRCMPNLAAAQNMSPTGLYTSNALSLEQKNHCQQIFSSLGSAFWVDHETDLDTLTALCGSGPGFIYTLLAQFQACASSWAEEQGLSTKQARTVAQQTLTGALALAQKTTSPFQTLANQVAVPNGTTEAGIKALNKALPELIQDTLQCAKNRCSNTLK